MKRIDLPTFLRWAYSDVLNNTSRGVLAEYIVGLAIRADLSRPREDWAAYDLMSRGGLKVEVKSAAYLQSWRQERLSKIAFTIAEKRDWNGLAGKYGVVARRHSDVFVFALLAHKERGSVDPLRVEQWRFYVAPTEELDRRFKGQKRISLASLESFAEPLSFEGLGRKFGE